MCDYQLYTAQEIGVAHRVSTRRACDVLRRGAVDTEHGLMRWGSNYTFLVSVTSSDVPVAPDCKDEHFLAIYKPRQGERPLWDFPDGTLCQREYAAYLTSEALNWCLVPPTVLRDAPRGAGSIQVFIDHDPERHYFTFDEGHIEQLKRVAAFDYAINNADRKGGHCLLDAEEHIWCIDHGLTFHSMPKLRTVIWDFAGQDVPEDLLSDLETLCQRLDDPTDAYRAAMSKLLSAHELNALQKRLQRLLTSGTYPLPGPGPNRPWPPV